MIVIKIEMWPFGEEENKYSLGTAHISNDASGTRTVGHYGFKLFDKRGRKFKEGKIKNFPRRRLLVWDLLLRVLRDAFGERNQLGGMAEVGVKASASKADVAA